MGAGPVRLRERFVFDFRTTFDRYEECVEMVGTEVVSVLHRREGRGAGPKVVRRSGELALWLPRPAR
jgi:hypothetical protein